MTGTNPKTGEVQLERHYQLYDHGAEDKIDGIITAMGVKYTTARDVAKKTIDLAFKKMNKTDPPSQTETTRLFGGNIERFEDFVKSTVADKPFGLDEKVMTHLSYNYGSAYKDILAYGVKDKSLVEKVYGSDEVLKAEVLHGVKQEMAQKLSDIVMRRTDLGSGGNPGLESLEDVAQIMGKELGWSDSKVKQEIDEVEQIFVPA